MKVLTVVGNRPQFVKAAPLSLALREAGIEEVSLHTGQHYDAALSDVFYDELGLEQPRYRLDLRTAAVEAMRPFIGDAIEREQPDYVVVLGDTNSTLAGAQAAARLEIPLAHVEAGLRSGDWGMPEERNRVEVDGHSAMLFAPDERSKRTLISEGVAGTIEVVGDVMADASMRFAPIARERYPRNDAGPYVVATIHREANVERGRLTRIMSGLNALVEPVVFPAHPRTRSLIERYGIDLDQHIALVEPLGYLPFASLASQARVIVTDSGGLQKEAYWYGVPCVTARPSTEWVDTVEAGANVLVDDDPDALARAVSEARMPEERRQLYGDGHASERVATALAGTISRRD